MRMEVMNADITLKAKTVKPETTVAGADVLEQWGIWLE